MKAKVKVGGCTIEIPVEHLHQQTALTSEFDNVPLESIAPALLIESNRTLDVKWYHKWVIGENRKALHITIPTELIEWED